MRSRITGRRRAVARGTRSRTSTGVRPRPPRGSRAGAGSTHGSDARASRTACAWRRLRERNAAALAGWPCLWTELRPTVNPPVFGWRAVRPRRLAASVGKIPRKRSSKRGIFTFAGCKKYSRELAGDLHEERLERELRSQVELLEGAPRLPYGLRGALGAEEPVARRVLLEQRELVQVDRRAPGADGDRDEVAVPGAELLELGQELLPLGAAGGALDAGVG